jgi:hypothetical protein
MLLAPSCDKSANYTANFSDESARSYMGAAAGESLPLCQNGAGKRRKSRKKTKKKAGAAVVGSLVAAYSVYSIYMTAYGLVSAYNTFLKPKGEKPLTVTQATINYVKMKGADVINDLRGMDTSQRKVVFRDYEAYIKKHPKENRMVIRRAPKKNDDDFKITSDEEDDYRVARDMARSKKRPRRKRSRKKRSRKKRTRRKRSQRGGAALSDADIAKIKRQQAEISAKNPTQSTAPQVPSRPPPKPPSKQAPKVPTRSAPKTLKKTPQKTSPPPVPTRSAPKTLKKTPKKTSPAVPGGPSSKTNLARMTLLPGETPGGGFGGGPSWKGEIKSADEGLHRKDTGFGV